MNKIVYDDIITFHPGYYLKELIDAKSMTQEELAKRLQISTKYMSELINGKCNLTDEMVLKLSNVFGTSTTMWLNLNKTYIEKKIEIDRRKQRDYECDIAKKMDYNFWVDLDLIEPAKKIEDKVKILQNYFKVASLGVLKKKDFLVQFGKTNKDTKDINIINTNAWVQTAINMGIKTNVSTFNKNKLKSKLSEIRSMTVMEPYDFVPRLKSIFSECGIAFILLPNLKNCSINGVVKWIGKEKVILALNDRSEYEYSFWFILFHEIGHVMQQRIKMLIINSENKLSEDSELINRLEKQADDFSKNILIPQEEYYDFIQNKDFKDKEILIEFANKMNLHPGIIVGRLQKEHLLSYDNKLNELKNN